MVFTRLHSMLNSYLCLKGRGGRYNTNTLVKGVMLMNRNYKKLQP